MERNIGKTDRIIRFIIGIVSIYLAIKISAWFYLIAIIAIVTATSGFCGLYTLFKINTCKSKTKKANKKAKKTIKKKTKRRK